MYTKLQIQSFLHIFTLMCRLFYSLHSFLLEFPKPWLKSISSHHVKPSLRSATRPVVNTGEKNMRQMTCHPTPSWSSYSWLSNFPIPSMYGIFTYIWLFLMVTYGKCIGKYTIHGCYGFCSDVLTWCDSRWFMPLERRNFTRECRQ